MLYDFFVKAKVTSFQASPSLVYISLTKSGDECHIFIWYSEIEDVYCFLNDILEIVSDNKVASVFCWLCTCPDEHNISQGDYTHTPYEHKNNKD